MNYLNYPKIKFKEKKIVYYKMGIYVIQNLDDYYSKILDKENNDKLILCFFTAKWCGPCKSIYPIINELAEKVDNLTILKIDVDDCEDVAEQCNIESMPTFRLHLNNSFDPSEQLVGADKTKLLNAIGKTLIILNEKKELINQPSQNSTNNSSSNNNSQDTINVQTNNEMDVPFMYNPLPNHEF